MYEERRNNFSMRSTLLQLLLIILFVFLMLWLFPSKSYLKENNTIKTNEVYTNYVETMSNAAKDYFTNDKMPSKVGEVKTITLKDMLNKKLLFTIDAKVNCDVEKSYVEVTKMENEFQMKVQLTCDEYSDYKMVTLGCKDYCNSCTTTTTKNPVVVKPTTTKVTKYEYAKVTTTGAYTDWSNWSSWYSLTSGINTTDTDTTDYEVSTYQYATGTTQVCKDVVVSEAKTEKTVISTKTPEKTTLVFDEKPLVKSTVATYKWVDAGEVSSLTPLTSTSTIKYTYNRSEKVTDCTNECKKVTKWIYDTQKQVKSGTKTVETCPTGYDKIRVSGTNDYVCHRTREVAITLNPNHCLQFGSDYELVGDKCVLYSTKTTEAVTKKECHDETTYSTSASYRVRGRSYETKSTTDTKWSTVKNDQTLLKAGYKLTGKTTTSTVTK